MKNFAEMPEEKASFTARCIRGAFIILNVDFLIKSLLIVLVAVSAKVYISTYIWIADYYYEIDDFVNWWIASGCALFFISIFGIALLYWKNAKMAIIYGIALSAVLIVQSKTVNRSVMLTGYSSGIVSTNLDKYLQSYRYDGENWRRSKIDWLQTTLTCCGYDGPSDWNGVYSVNSTFRDTSVSENFLFTMTPVVVDKIPTSCCPNDAAYGNAFCQKHHTTGCREPLYFIVASTLLNIAKFGLILAVIQVVTIINTVLLANVYRRRAVRQHFRNAAINEAYSRSTLLHL